MLHNIYLGALAVAVAGCSHAPASARPGPTAVVPMHAAAVWTLTLHVAGMKKSRSGAT